METNHETHFCDPCKFIGKKVAARGFCRTCDGNLCQECVKAHKHAKETRSHTVTDIRKLTTNSREGHHPDAVNHCEEHESILESYCKTHDEVCCRECMADKHQGCPNLVPLYRASEGVREKAGTTELAKKIEDLIAKFELMKEHEHKGIESVESQGKAIDETVKTFRNEVNALLDKLEMSIFLKRDEVVRGEKNVLGQRAKICDIALPILNDAVKQLSAVGKAVDDQTVFVTLKKTNAKLEKYTDVHDELLDGRGKFTLKFVPNQSVMRNIDSLGALVVRSTIQPVDSENSGGNASEKCLVKVGEVNVRVPTDEHTPTITGCTYLDDMRLVLADETNKCIKVFNADNEHLTTFPTDAAPWDLVAISPSEIAVRNSFSDKDTDENKILILSVSSDSSVKVVRSFAVDGRPRAIRYLEPHLFIACSEGKNAHVLIVDKKGKIVRKIKPKKGILDQPQYLAIGQTSNTIYISDFYNGIIALNIKGEVVFRFKDKNVTEYGGITIDTDGAVYNCAGKPYGIYRVVNEKKELVPLVTWAKGTIDPQAITYNEKNEQFLVTCCNSEKAYFFSYDE